MNAFVLLHIRIDYTFDSSLEFKQIGVWDLLKLNLSLGRFFLRSRRSVIRVASFSLLSSRWRFKLLCFLRFWDDFLVLLAFACNNHWHVCIRLIFGSEDDHTFFCVFETECSCLISFECNRFGCMISLKIKIINELCCIKTSPVNYKLVLKIKSYCPYLL